MTVILNSEIEHSIEKLKIQGLNPIGEQWKIYAAKDVIFIGGIYPLEIILLDQMPRGVVFIIAKRPEVANA